MGKGIARRGPRTQARHAGERIPLEPNSADATGLSWGDGGQKIGWTERDEHLYVEARARGGSADPRRARGSGVDRRIALPYACHGHCVAAQRLPGGTLTMGGSHARQDAMATTLTSRHRDGARIVCR
jgi:hypothetical protein